ncbi:MAG: SUMF1/EgtB/PvdO family nonheme iron enzyme, partial [Delftia sp.]|nr:SUMF1/EgtB/PvdO family nonheme iron enzyme [Delftia sp.]
SREWAVSPRRMVLQAVGDLARRFSKARYLVTCRQASYVSPWTLRGFEVAPLAEFDQARRDRFCALWYAELARRGQLEAQHVAGKVAGLQEATRRPDLARLAGNPLLLTVMALVHAREPELPEARALLYEKCVDVLLWLWERRKVDQARPSDLLTLLEKGQVARFSFVRALNRLAYDVHAEGGAQAGEADVRTSALIARLAALHPDRDLNWARDVTAFMRERAGLLVERRGDEVDPVLAFPHRTFQEYLAACWLTGGDEDTAVKAAELARQGDHWWEVVKLAAGRLLYVENNVSLPLSLVDFLCPERAPDEPDCWRLSRLAGETLLELKPQQMLRDATMGGQVRSRLERVRRRLATAIGQDEALDPRQRAAAGNTLAQLGDPRFRADAWQLPDEPLLGFVEIPAGPFLMGTRQEDVPMLEKRFGESSWYKYETPQHEVTLPAYYVARYPVTQAQYGAFVRATGHRSPAAEIDRERPYEWRAGEPPPHLLNHPVVLVSWRDARAYCAWLTEQLRAWKELPGPLGERLRRQEWQVRLPSEAE